MLSRKRIDEVLNEYNLENLHLGVIASHSALDVCDGAAEEGLPTIAICEKGRERTYAHYFKAFREKGRIVKGFVDETLILQKFSQVVTKERQQYLREKCVVFVPNRSFTSYVGLDEIENDFLVPILGSRNLLRTEEREERKNYYWLLDKAKLPFPQRVEDPGDIDSLVIVKLHHKVKKLERGFFTAASYEEFLDKSRILMKRGVISRSDLKKATIEEYIIGPVFNLDFFYSPLSPRDENLELLGIDWRFETSLDGHVRLPAHQQLSLKGEQREPEYTVVGHNSATLRESLLEKVFDLGERYVKATQKLYPPGIIGPFTLQTCVDKDLDFYIYDVAPRIGGGTNIHMSVGHPYGNALWRRPMSTGRRVALEIRRALESGRLKDIVT